MFQLLRLQCDDLFQLLLHLIIVVAAGFQIGQYNVQVHALGQLLGPLRHDLHGLVHLPVLLVQRGQQHHRKLVIRGLLVGRLGRLQCRHQSPGLRVHRRLHRHQGRILWLVLQTRFHQFAGLVGYAPQQVHAGQCRTRLTVLGVLIHCRLITQQCLAHLTALLCNLSGQIACFHILRINLQRIAQLNARLVVVLIVVIRLTLLQVAGLALLCATTGRRGHHQRRQYRTTKQRGISDHSYVFS